MSRSKGSFTGNSILTAVLVVAVGAEVAFLSRNHLVKRFDFTADREYTIAEPSRRIVASLPDRLVVKAFFTPTEKVPSQYVLWFQSVRDLLEEFAAYSAGRVALQFIDPAEGSEASQEAGRFGIQPIQVRAIERDEIVTKLVYVGLVLRYRDKDKTIPAIVPGQVASMEYQLTTAIKALTAEEPTRIAFFSREPPKPPAMRGMELPTPPERVFQELRNGLGERYKIEDVTLAKKAVPENADVLVALRPENVTEHEKFAIDQFLMRGGRLLVMLERAKFNPATGMRAERIESGIDDLLAHWGVEIPSTLVFDRECEKIGIRTEQRVGNLVLQGVTPVAYPYFPLVSAQRADGFSKTHPATATLSQVFLRFAWPVDLVPDRLAEAGLQAEVLVQSSPKSWRDPEIEVLPRDSTLLQSRELKLAEAGEKRSPLVVALVGSFPSLFAGKPAPSPEGTETTETRPAPIERGPETRVVIVGDAEFAQDAMMRPGPGVSPSDTPNFHLVANLVDWLTLDQDLIQIRSRGTTDRRLADMRTEILDDLGGIEPEMTPEAARARIEKAADLAAAKRRRIEWANYLGVPILVVLFGLVRFTVRRAQKAAYLGRAKGGA